MLSKANGLRCMLQGSRVVPLRLYPKQVSPILSHMDLFWVAVEELSLNSYIGYIS